MTDWKFADWFSAQQRAKACTRTHTHTYMCRGQYKQIKYPAIGNSGEIPRGNVTDLALER